MKRLFWMSNKNISKIECGTQFHPEMWETGKRETGNIVKKLFFRAEVPLEIQQCQVNSETCS